MPKMNTGIQPQTLCLKVRRGVMLAMRRTLESIASAGVELCQDTMVPTDHTVLHAIKMPQAILIRDADL